MEYYEKLKGYHLRNEEHWERAALLTAWIVNVCGLGLGTLKRRISPQQILGIKVVSEEKTKDTRKDYEALKKKHEHLHKKLFADQKKELEQASKDIKKEIKK